MARGINKAIILGNLADNPVYRQAVNSNGNFSVANITIATNEAYRDQQGNLQNRVEWHRVVLYGRLADVANQYLTKGAQVYVEGKIRTRSYDDKQNPSIKRYMTEIIASELQMLGSRPNNQQTGQMPNNGMNPNYANNQGYVNQNTYNNPNMGNGAYSNNQVYNNNVGNNQNYQAANYQQPVSGYQNQTGNMQNPAMYQQPAQAAPEQFAPQNESPISAGVQQPAPVSIAEPNFEDDDIPF